MMDILKEEYKKFLEDIERKITNKEELEYVKLKFVSFVDKIMDQIENIVDYKEEKFLKLEKEQKQLEDKMQKMQQIIENIEKDIYAEDGFDFEIICPYCNYEFIIDVDENKTEIKCPECDNIIELDWSGNPDDNSCDDDSCSGCHGCDNNIRNDSEEKDNYDEDNDM